MAHASDIKWPPGIVAEHRLPAKHTLGRVWKVRCDALLQAALLEIEKRRLVEKELELSKFIDGLKGAIEDYERNKAAKALVEADSEDEEDEQDQLTEEDIQACHEEYGAREAEHAALLDNIEDLDQKIRLEREAVVIFKWGARHVHPNIARLDAPLDARRGGPRQNRDDKLSTQELSRKIQEEMNTLPESSSAETGLKPSDPKAERGGGPLAKSVLQKLWRKPPKPRWVEDEDCPRVDLIVADDEEDFAAQVQALAEVDQAEIPPTDITFAAKIYSPLASVGGREGTTLTNPKYRQSAASCMDILRDSETLMSAQSKAVYSHADWRTSGLLPIVRSGLVKILDEERPPDFALAVYTPFATNGNLQSAIKHISGAKSDHWYSDELLLRNLKQHIQSMSVLENYGVFHGNIKPSNIYISADGGTLLLSDFVPRTQIIREWCMIGRREHTKHTHFLSPEVYKAIRDQVDTEIEYENRMELSKHDVFTLGMVYYHLLTRIDADQLEGLFKSRTKHDELLRHMVTPTRQLGDLIRVMLTWNPRDRPLFRELIDLPIAADHDMSVPVTNTTQAASSWGATFQKVVDFFWEDDEKKSPQQQQQQGEERE